MTLAKVTAQTIRRMKGAQKISALTASAMKGDDHKALHAGCDGYITKPIDTRKLTEQIAQWLEHRSAS